MKRTGMNLTGWRMAVRRIGTIALFIPALCRAQSYTITTVAGGGPESFPGLGDGGPATSAYLATPSVLRWMQRGLSTLRTQSSA